LRDRRSLCFFFQEPEPVANEYDRELVTCSGGKIFKVDLNTSSDGSGTKWRLFRYDASKTPQWSRVAFGPEGFTYGNNAQYIQRTCVDPATYAFVMLDQSGQSPQDYSCYFKGSKIFGKESGFSERKVHYFSYTADVSSSSSTASAPPPPTGKPSPKPTTPLPTRQSSPNPNPTRKPSLKPTPLPTRQPSPYPTSKPSPKPTPLPTRQPSPKPTPRPTPRPINPVPSLPFSSRMGCGDGQRKVKIVFEKDQWNENFFFVRERSQGSRNGLAPHASTPWKSGNTVWTCDKVSGKSYCDSQTIERCLDAGDYEFVMQDGNKDNCPKLELHMENSNGQWEALITKCYMAFGGEWTRAFTTRSKPSLTIRQQKWMDTHNERRYVLFVLLVLVCLTSIVQYIHHSHTLYPCFTFLNVQAKVLV
jgi:hypothetical protein